MKNALNTLLNLIKRPPQYIYILLYGFQSVTFAQNQQIDSLTNLLKNDKQDTTKVNHLLEISTIYYNQSNYKDALDYGQRAINLAQKLDFKKGIVKAYKNIGNIIYSDQSDYPKALEHYQKGLKIAEEIQDNPLLTRLCNNIGNVYHAQSDYPKSLEYYQKGLKIAEKIQDKIILVYSYNGIGNVYLDQPNYPKALEYYQKALKIVEEIQDKRWSANLSNNIGNVYYTQFDYPKALEYYQKGLKIAGEIQNKIILVNSYNGIGSVYNGQSDYPKAWEYYQKGLEIAKEMNDKSSMAFCYMNIGVVCKRNGELKKAEEYLKKSITLFEITEELNLLRQAEESIYGLYTTTHQYQSALEHYKKSVVLKDSIFSEQSKKQLVQKEMQYKFDKQQDSIKTEHAIEIAVEEEKSSKQKTLTGVTVAGLILVMIFSIFIFRSLRITRNQRELLQKKNKEITDSIHYAKRIQTALLTTDEYIKNNLPAQEHFILFKPKDIVSGDFYWALNLNSVFYIITADCTGHGVPGAMMSMLNISYLNENVIERNIRLPHEILNAQRKEIIQALNPIGSTEESRDGMDCILCAFDFDKMLLHFAAANNPVWLVRSSESEVRSSDIETENNNYEPRTMNYELIEYKADKMPVGKYEDVMKPFTLHTIELQKGDVIYTSTDGFADQFGTNGKKLMKKRLKEELLKIHHLPMNKQKEYLNIFFSTWKGNTEQVDDVTIIGIRV